MSSRKNEGVSKAKRGAPTGSQKRSQSERSGLKFPVARIHRILREGHYARRIGAGASVYLAAVLEYLACEILELSAKAAKDNNRSRISPRHILLAIKNDEELDELLKGVTISRGGVMPHIQAQLLPKKMMKSQSSNAQNGSSQEY